jgi:hypothetical protein
MATTTSIIVLLKFFAGRQDNAIIDFNEFTEYIKRYSEHHLEEQPSLVTYLSDTANVLLKELEKLADQRQILLLQPTVEKRQIVVIPFFTDKYTKRYKEILVQPQIPFPQEGDIPKKVPNEVITRRSAAEIINELLEKETLTDKYLYGIVLPHDSPTILLPSLVSIHTLIECAVLKIRTMLTKDEHHDYFMKKLTVSNPGKEMTAKNIFNRFCQNPDSSKMFKEPEDSFYFMTQLLFFIRQDYEKVKDYTAEDLAVLQSVYILEIVSNFYKTRAQDKNKKEAAIKNLEQQLSRPPYYFTYETITKFTSNSGVPLLGQYSEDELKAFLHAKTTESAANDLPEMLVFKTETENQPYFIYKNKVMPLILRLCSDARTTIREAIKKHWFNVMRSYDDLPEMKEQKAFEKRLEKETALQSPILYALLTSSFMPLIDYEVNAETDSSGLSGGRITLFENGRLIPYSDILLMDRQKLLTDTKILLPFWYAIPVISWIMKLIMRPPKAKKPKQTKTDAQIYHEKEAEKSRQDNQEAALAQNPAVSKKVALREAARSLEEELVPSSSTLDRELHSYEHMWNKLIGKVTHNNLTEDVNSLIKDYLRKVLRNMKSEGFNKERIENLAESLVKTPPMQKIGEPDALTMYIQLYIIKLVKNIPM